MKLKLDVLTNVKESVKRLGELSKSIGTVTKSTKKTTAGFKSAKKGMKSLGSETKSLNTDATKLNKSLKGVGGSLGGIKQLIGAGIFYKISGGVADTMRDALGMIEILNLFEVSMGTLAVKTDKALMGLAESTGLNLTSLRQSVGTYGLLARSMGATDAQASKLGVNATQLAVDLSSLMNVPINQVMRDLRSGLLGQSETVYKYGIDITEASIAVEAMRQGITKTVRAMSQGEKMMLRYNVMMNTTRLAQGDFAKTFATPANQLRILQERLFTLSQTFGTIFMPMLSAVLPYINAVVYALTKLMAVIAKFFGYEADFAEDQFGTFGGLEDGADSANAKLGKTKKALEAVKNAQSGMDELNVISEPKDSASGGSDGDGIGGGSIIEGMDLLGTNSMMEKINTAMEKTLAKLAKFAPLIFAIAGALLTLGLMNVFTVLTKVGGAMGLMSLGAFARALIPLIVIFSGIWIYASNVAKVFKEGLNINTLLQSLSGLVIILAGLAILFPAIAIPIAVVGALIGGLGLAIAHGLAPAISSTDLFSEGVSDLTKSKIEPFLEGMQGLGAELNKLDWGNIVIDDSIVKNISDQAKAIADSVLNELSADRNTALASMELLKDKYGEKEFSDLLKSTNNYYDSQSKVVSDGQARIDEILQKASDNKVALSEAESIEIQKIKDSWMDIGLKSFSAGEVEYKKIMTDLKDNAIAINVEQSSAILKSSMETRDGTIDNAKAQYSQLLLEADNMLEVGAINQEQYEKMVEVAGTTKDETIALAETQYDGIYNTTMEKLGKTGKYIDKETGDIKNNWEVFSDTMTKKTEKMGEDIKKSLSEFGENVGLAFKSMKETALGHWATLTNGLKLGFIGFANLIISVFENLLNGIIGKISDVTLSIKGMIDKYNEVAKVMPLLKEISFSIPTFNNVSFSKFGLNDAGNIKMYANGGFPDVGSMFVANENGVEMMGNIGGKTAVVNNDQIVEAVSTGVAKAVAGVMGNKSEQPIILTLDGEVIYTSQQKISRGRGANIGMGAFAR